MIQDADYLLVYGTLRAAFQNPFAKFLHAHSRYVGAGQFSGQLFDIGSYPGALYQPNSETIVWGDVYDIQQFKSELLLRLDEYEGIGDTFPDPQEYVRDSISVRCGGKTLRCWIYLYNVSIVDKKQIESGDYVRYVNL